MSAWQTERPSRSDRIVIVGGGQAGCQAVASLRDEGYAGGLTLVGDEPFLPYQRPPLSKAYLQGKVERERLFLRSETFYRQHDCALRLGVPVSAIDRTARVVRLQDGDALAYDRLLLATGATARHVRVPGAGLEGLHYLRTIADADKLRCELHRGRRLAIVGGGYIGLEVAAVAAAWGLKVTVFEALERPMARVVSPAVSHFFTAVHRAAGVEILLGTRLEQFEGAGHLTGIRAGGELYPADVALIGVGAAANDSLAKAAGLATDDGIIVDAFTQTSDPHVFAAGDCTRHPSPYGGSHRLECVQNAVDQAKHAALAMLDRPKPYAEVPWFWSEQFQSKLQIAGLARADDVLVVRGDTDSQRFSVFHLRSDVISAVEAINSPPDYMAGRKLIEAKRRVAPERLVDCTRPVKSLLDA